MKLKRFLSLCAVCIFATVLLAGCSSDNTQDTQTPTDTTSSDNSQTDTSSDSQDTSSDSQDTSSDKTEKDTPSVSIPWNEVSDDYEDAAVEAKNEITATDSISVRTTKSSKMESPNQIKSPQRKCLSPARRLRHLPNAPAMFRRKNLSALVPAQRIMSKRFTVVDPLPFPMPITI